MSDINLIIQKHEKLEKQLIAALSTMERKDNIAKIRLEILQNQRECPHYSTKYNWVEVEGKCPYCGVQLEGINR